MLQYEGRFHKVVWHQLQFSFGVGNDSVDK